MAQLRPMTVGELSGCVFVSGMPGAGKSTLTGLAAQLLPRAARIKADDINEMILSGRVGFRSEPEDERLRQEDLCNRNVCSLANNFIDFGFTVFIDRIVPTSERLDALVDLLAPRPVHLVTLAPGVAACQHRNATREPSERFEFDGYHQLEAEMRGELGGVGWWFDTSALTPENSAEQLVREVAQRGALT